MQFHFYKYQGTGNDFVIFDNREGIHQFTKKQVSSLCDRRFGIGADGLMLLNKHDDYDFEMKYYNADGGESSMCGNGGRCMIQFAHDRGIIKTLYSFLAIDGKHAGKIMSTGEVALQMIDVEKITAIENAFILNTGSPHYIAEVASLDDYDVFAQGRAIRNSSAFQAQGINVNFIEPLNKEGIKVRTYERGVEDETFSCGTGVTAAALVFGGEENGQHELNVETKGGKLKVRYEKQGSGFQNIWLIGPATFVFDGDISL